MPTSVPGEQLIVTCAGGLEELLSGEVRTLGGSIDSRSSGLVLCRAPLASAYRMCLWSRFASRILLVLSEGTAPDADALYHAALAVDWSAHLGADCTFAVDATLRQSRLPHSHYAALRVKDAVADSFTRRERRRPSVDTRQPDIRIHAMIVEERAFLCLDLSGDSLHRRGYRSEGGEAPMKETLAAAVATLAGWPQKGGPDAILLDPLCGSGTLLIEAALMATDCAPGLMRRRWGFQQWRGHKPSLWAECIGEAQERRATGMRRRLPEIIGYDASRAAVRGALDNISRAGLATIVRIEQRELAGIRSPFDGSRSGLIVTNPPYGDRLSGSESNYLHRCLGRVLRREFCGWRAAVFSGNTDVIDTLGGDRIERYRLYNGPIVCQLRVFDVSAPAQPSRGALTLCDQACPDMPDLANRIRKNMKRLAPWIRSEGVACYRIYDADIPEYNFAVDVYEHLVHVQEYAPPKTVDPERAAERMAKALRALPELLQVKRSQVFVKVRRRQKGAQQYQKRGAGGKLYEVGEYGCRFLVNLTDYLDTGLFLDHRLTRKRIRDNAAGRRFLNLFGYTGTATVHAAAGGARTTTTVDLSPAYGTWARCNLALNGFGGERHELFTEDCLAWLERTDRMFDLIFLDPPTFSNSRRTDSVLDVQRDHAGLIRRVMGRLSRDGMLLFSTNFRRFSMGVEIVEDFAAREITRETIPPDFARNPTIHRCWEIRHRG